MEFEKIILLTINGLSFIIILILFVLFLLERKKVKEKLELIEFKIQNLERDFVNKIEELNKEINKDFSQLNIKINKLEKLLKEPIDIEEWINESDR